GQSLRSLQPAARKRFASCRARGRSDGLESGAAALWRAQRGEGGLGGGGDRLALGTRECRAAAAGQVECARQGFGSCRVFAGGLGLAQRQRDARVEGVAVSRGGKQGQ